MLQWRQEWEGPGRTRPLALPGFTVPSSSMPGTTGWSAGLGVQNKDSFQGHPTPSSSLGPAALGRLETPLPPQGGLRGWGGKRSH